jgi:hypothetical protein
MLLGLYVGATGLTCAWPGPMEWKLNRQVMRSHGKGSEKRG